MHLHFDNSFARLPAGFYSEVEATPVRKSEVLHVNKALAHQLGITDKDLNSADFADYFAGNKKVPGSHPLAMVYAGHQFGYYVPQLGDGRALLLGEVLDKQGERWDIQLKGAGQTPYSRMADGRAVLRSTIREYLCSEAMHALGIPTTRALCLVATHEPVVREEVEPGAILTRVAQSHLRIGHFEFFYYTGRHEELKQLADYVIKRHYPHYPCDEVGYAHVFEQAVLNTARLIAQWQAFGFCHGVMNTDNMSILGLTIDYGPFGFLDAFNAHHICNSSDETGRYAYDKQPSIAYWNLLGFGQALTPLIAADKLQSIVAGFQDELVNQYEQLMHDKLGWQQKRPEDMQLVNELLTIMQDQSIDYTLFFRTLCDYQLAQDFSHFNQLGSCLNKLEPWMKKYDQRIGLEIIPAQQRQAVMKQCNPRYILRNYLVQQAIERAYQQDYQEIDRLFSILQHPFDDQEQYQQYAKLPPNWAKKICVSCSS